MRFIGHLMGGKYDGWRQIVTQGVAVGLDYKWFSTIPYGGDR
jgi:hypothetical protein